MKFDPFARIHLLQLTIQKSNALQVMSPLTKGVGDILFLGRIPRSRRQRRRRHKISCPLCNLNILWTILMILGRSGRDDVSHTRLTTLAFLLLELSPFVLFEKDFVSALQFKYLLEYFDGTWQKCRTGPDDVSRTRMTSLAFLLLALSPFVIFDSDNPLISCPLCKSDPLEYFYDTWKKCRTGPDDVSRTRMTTLPFLLLALSPFVMSESDY